MHEIYTYTEVHIDMYMHKDTFVKMHAHTHLHICTQRQRELSAYIHVQTDMHRCSQMHMHVQTHAYPYMYLDIKASMFTLSHTYKTYNCIHHMRASIHVGMCVYTGMHVHTQRHTCAYPALWWIPTRVLLMPSKCYLRKVPVPSAL